MEQQRSNVVPVCLVKLMAILPPVLAVLSMEGCGDKAPTPTAMETQGSPVSYIFRGRYQGVESSNQYAVWVVDTHTGAVVRCGTDACGAWIMPKVSDSTPTSSIKPPMASQFPALPQFEPRHSNETQEAIAEQAGVNRSAMKK